MLVCRSPREVSVSYYRKLGHSSANCIVHCEVMSMKRLFMMQWLIDTLEVPPFSPHCSRMARSSVRPRRSWPVEMSWFSLGRMGSAWVTSGRPWINLIVSTYETNAGKRCNHSPAKHLPTGFQQKQCAVWQVYRKGHNVRLWTLWNVHWTTSAEPWCSWASHNLWTKWNVTNQWWLTCLLLNCFGKHEFNC